MKGCIVLDIDGTITTGPESVPAPVLDCLRTLRERGWGIAFATGRTYAYALETLRYVDFPFFFAVQNGSELLRMPEEEVLAESYISSAIVTEIDKMTETVSEDFLVYAGRKEGDFCYYRPENFTPLFLNDIERIRPFSKKPWKEVQSFAFPSSARFPLLKYLGTKEEMIVLYDKLKRFPGIKVSCIRDPVSDEVYLNLITSEKATKGNALVRLRSYFPSEAIFIAAGDDYNDVSMLEEADIAIAMEGSPPPVCEIADIIAKKVEYNGIIDALWRATREKP